MNGPTPGFSRMLLLRRSLRHYRRAHLPAALGVTLTAAVLTGALLVGESVRATLERFARERTGGVLWALELPPGRRLSTALPRRLPDAGTVLTLPAMLLAEDADGLPVQVPAARVLGVEEKAWALISGGLADAPEADEIWLGERLARRLNVREGDAVSLRVARWSPLPLDAPLSARGDSPTVRWRGLVRGILPDDQGGRFGLEASQTAPLNAFVNLQTLQQRSGWEGFANRILAGHDAEEALRHAWHPRDLGVRVRERDGVARLAGDRIFLEDSIATALPPETVRGFTYLVDSLENLEGTRRTPYSFVMGLSPQDNPALGCVPSGAGPDGIVINAWLAETLDVGRDDMVRVRYRRWEASGEAVTESRLFRIRATLPMEDAALERERMPDFPGLTDVERCADWNIGMDLDPEALEDEANETYWNRYGPTPKAFLPLETLQEMAGTRFGSVMETRIPLDPEAQERFEDGAALLDALRQRLDPASLGLSGRKVAAAARAAARGSTDFGGLFLGLSTFLIAAALLLSALLCGLAALRRKEELGTLRVLGFTDRAVRHLLLLEFAGIAFAGTAAGALLGAGYARALLWMLGRGWSGALAGAAPVFSGSASTLLAGLLTAGLCALGALWLGLRGLLRSGDAALLHNEPVRGTNTPSTRSRGLETAGFAGALAVAAALAQRGPYAALAGGALVLAAAIESYRRRGVRMRRDNTRTALDWRTVGMRSALLRPGRDLAVMTVLGCGTFLVFAVTAMRQDVTREATSPHAPTGGFELLAELSVPLPAQDLPAGDAFRITPLRILEGEDAGCLNLNQAVSPRLLGVPVESFVRMNLFGLSERWRELDRDMPDGSIPGWTGDSDTAVWGLKARLHPEEGTRLEYRSESGMPWPVRLTGSPSLRLTLFQGSVLVSSERLAKAFPSAGGSSWLLVNTTEGEEDAVTSLLYNRLRLHGPEIQRVTDRLRSFARVEHTYLDMFLVLGGLGLLVATLGVGLLVLRNAEERRDELKALSLIGVRRRDRALLLWHAAWPAQMAGIAAGALAAGFALWPALWAMGPHGLPWRTILTLLALLVSGALGGSLALAWHGSEDPG